MRPKQWIKNGVIFAALVFDRQLGFNNLPALFRTVAGFIIFCLLSGVVYIINDITDVEADRHHPDKKERPIASGELSIRTATVVAVIILVVIFPVAYLLSPAFTLVALAYFGLNLAYSKWLKHIPIIDVFSIALGFILRVLAGASLITVARFSPWLYVVTSIGALLLGFGKRRGEIFLLADNAQSHRKVLDGYNLPLLDQLITIVSATTIVAYSLYTFSAPNLPDNNIMMLTIPFVVYGIFRYIYLLQVENRGGAPEEIFLNDRPIQFAVLLWGFSILIIFYIF
jgi:4-hydroxybenzoate polyprenyltransferase